MVVAIKKLYYRTRNFLRTGSFTLPALSSNIAAAATADNAIAAASRKLEAHQDAIVVKKLALAQLKGVKNAVHAEYASVESDAASLLASL